MAFALPPLCFTRFFTHRPCIVETRIPCYNRGIAQEAACRSKAVEREVILAFYGLLALTSGWFAFMTWLSHQDGEHTRRTSWRLAEGLSALKHDTRALDLFLRRAAHGVLFAVFSFLYAATLHAGGLPAWLFTLAPAWAWADEATKRWCRGRHFSWADVARNLAGVLLGVALFAVLRALFPM